MTITAAQFAEERQRLAATGTGYVPHWHELTDREREQATVEAGHWLTAMRNLTNQPAPGAHIAELAIAYVNAPEGTDRVSQAYHELEAAVRHMQAVDARQAGRD